ncbi:hypothetical protein [Streptomyces sp. NPDC003036]|uniref:hypothetical protein n=1 Tax=Streptomyces sp. NPDC003036 TaxID=3154442 RepID=UPI0033BA8976
MANDVDTLATALYAATDDMLTEHPDLAPWRPLVGITPRLSDAELVTLATMQAIESINEALRDSLTSTGTEGAHTRGVIARLMHRIVALTAAIWHDVPTRQTVLRSLFAYDQRPLGIDHLELRIRRLQVRILPSAQQAGGPGRESGASDVAGARPGGITRWSVGPCGRLGGCMDSRSAAA